MSADASDPLDRASALIAGARNAEELDLRAFYAARARLAIEQAEQRTKALRASLINVESELTRLGRDR